MKKLLRIGRDIHDLCPPFSNDARLFGALHQSVCLMRDSSEILFKYVVMFAHIQDSL